MNIKFLALHHVGGIQDNSFASSINTTAEQVNQYHKQKWNFISSLGKYGGYNIYISRTGQWTQFRAIGEETAHTLKYNMVAVGICFAGNFIKQNGIPVDTPTIEQIMTYRTLAIALLDNNRTMLDKLGVVIAPNTEIKITPTNIHKHSYYQPNTECNCLPDSWGRDLLKDHIRGYGNLQMVYASILELATRITRFRKIGATTYDCGATRN